MKLTAAQKSTIERVINVFETGRPDGDYGAIAIFQDGPHDIRQITYGRSQTTEFGKLRILVQTYVAAGGAFSESLRPYAEKVGSLPLVDDVVFKDLLRQAGRKDPVMARIQDEFFDAHFFAPAMAWADANGFASALALLVIYDSFIHSGGILWLLRALFPESPPRLGGAEAAWIRAYVDARHRWLSRHHREAVRKSAYRTRELKRQVDSENWDLLRLPIHVVGADVQPREPSSSGRSRAARSARGRTRRRASRLRRHKLRT